MWLRRRSSASRLEGQDNPYGRVCLDIGRESPEEEDEDTQSSDGLDAMERLFINNAETGSTNDQEDDDQGLLQGNKVPTDYSLSRRASRLIQEQRRISSSRVDPVNNYKGYFKLCSCGILIVALAYAVYTFNPLITTKEFLLAMKDGSFLSNVWKVPPIKLYFKIYIFNVTNAKEFISGHDAKLKYEEIGPYVYSETMVNSNVTWNGDKSVSFTPKRTSMFEREMSVGDPNQDFVTVPNIVLIGMASMLHKSSFAINLAFSSLVSYLKPEAIKNLTVQEYLWGYDDNLVQFASKTLPSWIDFKKFGLLDRMLDEGENRITIATEDTRTSQAFAIQNINGSPRLPEWEPNSHNESTCDKVAGTIEGLLLPRNLEPNKGLTVYRKAFCRPLPLKFVNSSTSERGFPSYVYTLADDALDPANPENDCYCTNGECLPLGLSDLSPCYYKIPVAMSMPHFYGGAPELVEGVEGMNPDPEKHASLVEIQPDAGVPLRLFSRIQLNLVVKKTRMVQKIRAFNNIVLPVMWLQVEMGELPGYINLLLNLLLISGPVIQNVMIGLLAALGFALIFVANVRFAWTSRVFTRHGTLISRRGKTDEKNSLWAGQYTQLIPIPLSTISVARNR